MRKTADYKYHSRRSRAAFFQIKCLLKRCMMERSYRLRHSNTSSNLKKKDVRTFNGWHNRTSWQSVEAESADPTLLYTSGRITDDQGIPKATPKEGLLTSGSCSQRALQQCVSIKENQRTFQRYSFLLFSVSLEGRRHLQCCLPLSVSCCISFLTIWSLQLQVVNLIIS